MAVYSFSTKTSRPEDTKAIDRAKALCAERGLNFSTVVVRLIEEWERNERQVPSN